VAADSLIRVIGRLLLATLIAACAATSGCLWLDEFPELAADRQPPLPQAPPGAHRWDYEVAHHWYSLGGPPTYGDVAFAGGGVVTSLTFVDSSEGIKSAGGTDALVVQVDAMGEKVSAQRLGGKGNDSTPALRLWQFSTRSGTSVRSWRCPRCRSRAHSSRRLTAMGRSCG
jgi:hypothetical protein